MYLDSWISSASMVGMSAFTLYLDCRLELFFSSNPAKIIYLIFYRQILRSLHLPVSLQMKDWKKKKTNKTKQRYQDFHNSRSKWDFIKEKKNK